MWRFAMQIGRVLMCRFYHINLAYIYIVILPHGFVSKDKKAYAQALGDQ